MQHKTIPPLPPPLTSSSSTSSVVSFPGSVSVMISLMMSMFRRTTSSSDSSFATCSGFNGPMGPRGWRCERRAPGCGEPDGTVCCRCVGVHAHVSVQWETKRTNPSDKSPLQVDSPVLPLTCCTLCGGGSCCAGAVWRQRRQAVQYNSPPCTTFSTHKN